MAKRLRHAMPDDVSKALSTGRVRSAYAKRPAYQRNDYIGWIIGAKQPETRSKRIEQMVDELKRGKRYMKAAWNPAKAEQLNPRG